MIQHRIPARGFRFFAGRLALVLALSSLAAPGIVADETESERRLATLRYGIEGQVVELIAALKAGKDTEFKAEILAILEATTSQKIREAALDYFGALLLSDAVDAAAALVRLRDSTPDATVAAAFSYLIALKSPAALPEAGKIVADGEKKYLVAAIKMMGAAGSAADASVLVSTYEGDSTPSVRQEILLALGRMKAAGSWDLLAKVAADPESGKVERMYACASLGELADPRGIPVLVAASGTDDPNIRAYAISALRKFGEPEAAAAIIQGLRDPHVIPRTAATKAAGELRLAEAVPFLEYKVKYDPEKTVREAAMDALGEIGGEKALGPLIAFLEDGKNAAAYRAKAFVVLAAVAGGSILARAEAVFAAAQAEKDRAFFTAMARAVIALDRPGASRFVGFILADKDYAVRLGGIAWAERNGAREHLGAIEAMSLSDPVESVKKRALAALDRIKSR